VRHHQCRQRQRHDPGGGIYNRASKRDGIERNHEQGDADIELPIAQAPTDLGLRGHDRRGVIDHGRPRECCVKGRQQRRTAYDGDDTLAFRSPIRAQPANVSSDLPVQLNYLNGARRLA
jgi:hypothetical protein